MKKLSKLITWPLIFIFLHQNIGWSVPAPQLSTISHQLSTIFIPEQYGRIEKPVTSQGQSLKSQVILIKDAHCNYEAQTNITKILDILIRDYKIELVGEEGASGHINPSIVLESNPEEEIRKDVSDKFLKNGLLVASEALSINKGKEPGFTIWGIEDLKLYLKDYKAFRDTFGTNSTGKHFIELLLKTIEQLKKKIYPEELQEFDRFVKGYESNEIPLSRFIKVLYYNHGIPSNFKNLKLILKSIRLEEVIDFNNVEKERANLIKGLEKSLPSEDLQELIKQSLLYKLGKIPVVEYYKYLEPLATSQKPQAINHKLSTINLVKYIKLVKLQEKLDETILFKELETLSENIYTRLCTDKISCNLHQLDKDINILNKIFRLEATRENMAYYKENQIRFKPENLLQFIRIQAPLNNITLPPELNDGSADPSFIEDVTNAITPAEEFYRLAVERDTALVENLLGVMQKNKKDKAVLVCGGFHAEGIKKILEDKGISILTITPSITKLQEDSNEIYLRRMMDERVDPERMLAELGLETLRPPIATGPEGRKIGLPQPLIDALRGRGREVGERLTPKDFLDILPLLRELYEQGGSLASFIAKAVEDYNASLPAAEKIVLEKPSPIAPEATPPAHIAYMGVPEGSPHYSVEKVDVERIITDLEGKTVSKEFEWKIANIDKQLLQGLEVTDQEFLAMLIGAFMEAEKYPGADKSRLRDITTIALLNKSSHLAENHVGDGFIGINAYVLKLYQKLKERFGKAAANNLIQFLLEHELVHELTGEGEEIESGLMKRDAERFVNLFGENTDAIIDLLETTVEFIEWVKFYSYKDTATKSFSALNRTKYEEDLVQALESGETTVQAAHLKIQDFKGEFNARGEDWAIGHILGDLALEIIGFMLQRFLNAELEKYGAKATVYNQGPGFYIIFQNITNPSIVKVILEKLVEKNSEFKKAVIEGIKWELKNVLPPDVYRMVSFTFNTFTTNNFNIYGGISELQRTGPKELEEAKAVADRLDIQAIEIAKYAQLTINEEMRQRYIEILARATSILQEGRIEEKGHEIDKRFTELLQTARNIPENNIEQFDTTKRERVNVSKAYVLNREYTSFHIPMEESYKPEEAFEELFREYAGALEKGDFEKIRRIQKVIARKAVSYKDTRIYYGNQRFKDTIEYIIRNRPKVSLKLTYRIGGDEYGTLIWDASAKVLRILRFDGNNIGATTFQWGREIGDKVIDEQLRIIQETEDVSNIPERMLEFFDNMGGRALQISKKLYNQLKNRLPPDYFEIRDGQYFLIKIPDVTVTYRGKTFTSRPMVSIGEVVVDTKLIPEDKLDREYSVIQGRADNAANKAKDKLKHYQSEHNGQIDTALPYEIATPFTSEHIPSFREYTPPRANSEIAGFIVRSAELREAAGRIAGILKNIEAPDILKAIHEGLDGSEKIDIMGLLRDAQKKGINPEQIFNLAVKIAEPLDTLLDEDIKKKVDKVIAAILKMAVVRAEEEKAEERPILELLQPGLLADRIIQEKNPVLAAFLFELLKAQIEDNADSVKAALGRIADEGKNKEIQKLARNYLLQQRLKEKIAAKERELFSKRIEETGVRDAIASDIAVLSEASDIELAEKVREQMYKGKEDSIKRLQRKPDTIRAIDSAIEVLHKDAKTLIGLQKDLAKKRQAAILVMLIFHILLLQDEADQRLPYVPHGINHSLNVRNGIENTIRNSRIVRESLEKAYGSEDVGRVMAILAGWMHDIGYVIFTEAGNEAIRIASELGIPDYKTDKGYHATLGVPLVNAPLTSDGTTILSLIDGLFGLSSIRGHSQGSRNALEDIEIAIKYHGAYYEKHKEDGLPGTGIHKYRPGSMETDILVFLVRLSDNTDLDLEGRLHSEQANPFFLDLLKVLNMDMNRDIEEIKEDFKDNREIYEKTYSLYLRETQELGEEQADLQAASDFNKIIEIISVFDRSNFPHFAGMIGSHEIIEEGDRLIIEVTLNTGNRIVPEDILDFQVKRMRKAFNSLRFVEGKEIDIRPKINGEALHDFTPEVRDNLKILQTAIDRLSEGDQQRTLLQTVLAFARRNPDLIESEKSFKEGEEIIQQGFAAQEDLTAEDLYFVYILLEGELEIYQTGSATPFAKIANPSLFGEMAVIMGKRTASVKVSKPSKVFRITRDAFIKLMRDPLFAVEYGKLVKERRKGQQMPARKPIEAPSIPPAAPAAAGTKSHKAGNPKVGGREAQNEDVDFVVDSWFGQDRVYCGYKSKNTPRAYTINTHTRRPVESSSEAQARMGEAFRIIGKWRNKWKILRAIRNARKSGLLYRQLARLDDQLEELQGQREQMAEKGLDTNEIGKRITLLEEHMRLLNEFIRSPRKILNKRLGSVYVMVLKGLDFLVYNNPENYWAGHSSTSRNAIYVPQIIYDKLIDSPNALAAFLMDELIDGIVGRHTELSDELIQLLDPSGELTSILRLAAEANNALIDGHTTTVTNLINADMVLDAVKELERIFESNLLPPSCLPNLLRIVLTNIEERQIDTRLISMFAFTLSGSQPIRDILHDLIRDTAYPHDISSSDLRLNGIVDLIRHPNLLFEADEWDRFVADIKTGLKEGRVEEMVNTFKDYLLDKTREIERIKRYLALFFAEITPDVYQDAKFKGFIYGILSELKDTFSPIEYIESAIHIISKVEGLHIDQIVEVLKMLAKIEGYTGREALLEEYSPIFTQLGISEEIAKEYFRFRAHTIFSTGQIELVGITKKDLETAGYTDEAEFKEEIAGYINKVGLLEKSIEAGITPSAMAQARLRITRIHCSGHTLVCLGTVDINGSINPFVLKKTFGLYDLTLKSDVVGFYKKLVEEAGELAERLLVRPLGEWITPLNRDKQLMGYIRTEEYLPGLNLDQIANRFGTDSEEYRLAEELSASLYYILFRNIAKGRWFIYDANGGNVMLIPTKDGGITGKVVDIEARLDLPEGLEDRYFLTFLKNRGIHIGDIEDIRGLANSFVRDGRFNLGRYDSTKVANLIGALTEQAAHITGEPIAVTTRPEESAEEPKEPTRRIQIDLREVPRVVAIGDVHGDLDALKETLMEARLIDEDGHWIGGNATLVQLGDIVDRGPDSIGTLNYLLQLQDEAEKTKGKVVLLIGNHELAYLNGNIVTGMRLNKIIQRIKEKEKNKEAITKDDYDELDMAKAEYAVIKGRIEEAVSKERIQTMHVSGNTVFVHAGIKPRIYKRLRKDCRIPQGEIGIRKIAEFCNKKLRDKDYIHYIFSPGTYKKGVDMDGSAIDAGILWTRLDDKAVELPGIRQVVGHSVMKQGIVRYKATFGIDVGSAKPFGGGRAFLEITPEGEIKGSERGPGADDTWAERPFTWTGVRPPAQPQAYAGMAHFEELAVPEDLVYEDGTKVRGVLSAEDFRRIKDSIQRDGKPVETGLGITVKLKDSELNSLLLNNLADLLQKLPPQERNAFLTALVANAPPEGLVLAILDQSEHLGENCQGDGFIGVNKYLLLKLQDAIKKNDQPTMDALSNLLQVILYHELRHEALIFEKEVLMEKFGYRPKDLSTREQILFALSRLSPLQYRVLTEEVEFRQNLVDIELLNSEGTEILVNLRLLRADSHFTASARNKQRRESLKTIGQKLYVKRHEADRVSADETPVDAWYITPDGEAGQPTELKLVPGVGYSFSPFGHSELLIGELAGDEAVYTTDIMSCVGIAFRGFRNGKDVFGLLHILPSVLEKDFSGSKIFQLLKEQGIEIDQIQIVVTNDNALGVAIFEGFIENIKAAFKLPQDRIRILRSTADAHMAVNNKGISVVRYKLDKDGAHVTKREVLASPWPRFRGIDFVHMIFRELLERLKGSARERIQQLLDAEGHKILDFVREESVPPTEEQRQILDRISSLRPGLSPENVFFIPPDSIMSIGERDGLTLDLGDGVKEMNIILINSTITKPLQLANTLIHESYHAESRLSLADDIGHGLNRTLSEGITEILTEEKIAEILETDHPLAVVLAEEVNREWESLLGLGVEGPAVTAVERWRRLADAMTPYQDYKDLALVLRELIGEEKLISMYRTGSTAVLYQALGDRMVYLERLAKDFSIPVSDLSRRMAIEEAGKVINNPNYNEVRFHAYKTVDELLHDPVSFPGGELYPEFYRDFLIYLLDKDIFNLLVSKLTTPGVIREEIQNEIINLWVAYLETAIVNNIVNEITKVLTGYDIKIEDDKREELIKILMRAYNGKVQINLLGLINRLLEVMPPEIFFQLTADIAEPINKYLGTNAAYKGGNMVAAVLEEILELIPEERRAVAETDEERLLKTIQKIAADKDIDPNSIQSVFDALKMGLQILRIDPNVDFDRIDSNYFELIDQIAYITGIDPQKIREIIFGRRIERSVIGEIKSDSTLAPMVKRLRFYQELQQGRLDLDLDVKYGLFPLDFQRGEVDNGIRYLSNLDAVEYDLNKAFKSIQGLMPKETNQRALVSISEKMFFTYLELKAGNKAELSHNPGLQALVLLMEKTKTANVRIGIRTKKDRQGLLERVIAASGLKNVEVQDEINNTQDAINLRAGVNLPPQNVVIITDEDFKADEEIIKAQGLKIFGAQKESDLHAVLLFGVFYALIEDVIEDNKISPVVIQALKALGVDNDEIERIMSGGLFFTVKLIRIKEKLEEFQNRRITIDIAA